MTRVERFHPGTKVANWASGAVAAPLAYVFPQGGFSVGGDVASGTGNSIDKMTFDTETSAVIAATLSFTVTWLSALPNSGTAGYTRASSNLDKMPYATETNSSISNASSSNNYLAGAGNVGVAGYWYGGHAGSDNAEISKVVFATDTSSTLSATLSSSRRGTSALTNDGTAGYTAGGVGSSTTIDKLTYSNDSRSTLSATLDEGGNDHSGVSNKGSAGYHTSGSNVTNADLIEKLTFSNDTSTAISATMSSTVTRRGEFEWQANAGYITGGYTGIVTTIDKLTYSTEAASTISPGLAVGRQMHAGHGNSGGSY
jgi:hypothetical protein